MEDIGLREFFEKEHGLVETDHRTSRRNGRSHIVCPLQLLPFG